MDDSNMLDTTAPTPLQQVGNFLVKRDDCSRSQVCAAARRAPAGLWAKVLRAGDGCPPPQGNVVAHVAKALGVPTFALHCAVSERRRRDTKRPSVDAKTKHERVQANFLKRF